MEGATSVLALTVVIEVAGVDQSGAKSINPAEGAFIPPLPPAGVVTVVNDGVVCCRNFRAGIKDFRRRCRHDGHRKSGMFRSMADVSVVRHGAHGQRPNELDTTENDR